MKTPATPAGCRAQAEEIHRTRRGRWLPPGPRCGAATLPAPPWSRVGTRSQKVAGSHACFADFGPRRDFRAETGRWPPTTRGPVRGLLGERGPAWAARHDPFRAVSAAGAAAGACSAASRVA